MWGVNWKLGRLSIVLSNLAIILPLWISTPYASVYSQWSFTAIHDHLFPLCKWQFFCSTTSPNHLLAIETPLAALAHRTSMSYTLIFIYTYIYIFIWHYISTSYTHTYEQSCQIKSHIFHWRCIFFKHFISWNLLGPFGFQNSMRNSRPGWT